MGGAGRWSVWRRGEEDQAGRVGDDEAEAARVLRAAETEALEQWAWQLLRRWGVVFRDLLAREPGAPKWWQLLGVFRRLEARGEIRGGRFVEGPGGEQFALGATVRRLRQLRVSTDPICDWSISPRPRSNSRPGGWTRSRGTSFNWPS